MKRELIQNPVPSGKEETPLSKPLISVLITCHNQAKFIGDTIRSVTHQSWTNLECIVVDDGSTDHSGQVIESLRARDSRIHFIKQQNKGVSAARNAGFLIAKGEYIQFLDGDDLLKTDKLERHINHFQTDPVAGVSYGQHEFFHTATGKTSRYGTTDLQRKPLKQMLESWFDGTSLPIHAGLFRRNIWSLNELPFPDDYHGRCEDWVFLVNIALKDVEFAPLQDVLCVYRMGSSNFTEDSLAWNAAAIKAARYISRWLPPPQDEIFLDDFTLRTLKRFLNLEKPTILRSSRNWRIGNKITRPFFLIAKYLSNSLKRPNKD